jgi:hypothetical protein
MFQLLSSQTVKEEQEDNTNLGEKLECMLFAYL